MLKVSLKDRITQLYQFKSGINSLTVHLKNGVLVSESQTLNIYFPFQPLPPVCRTLSFSNISCSCVNMNLFYCCIICTGVWSEFDLSLDWFTRRSWHHLFAIQSRPLQATEKTSERYPSCEKNLTFFSPPYIFRTCVFVENLSGL